VSPISFTQQGIVTQYELAKILIITSDGVLEVFLPLTDDDRRDMEIHLRGKFARSIALQVKSTTHLSHPFKADHRVQTHEVGRRVLDIFANESGSRGASPLPAELAALDGIVLVGPTSPNTTA